MKEIDVIYKILHILHSNMDNPKQYDSLLTAEALGISIPKWCHIMAMLAEEGYISGAERFETFDAIGNGYPNIKLERPGIGLKGLEYLAENPLMVKAAQLEGLKDYSTAELVEDLKYNIELEFDTSPLGEVEKKIESMSEHLEKAMELAGSIASTDIDLQVNAVVDGRHTEFARVTTDTEHKIQSLHFDAEKWRLEINGEAFEAPVMLVWPDDFTNEAWTRRMIVNSLPKEESIKRATNGDRLPILSISFIDGTGSYSISNRVLDDERH